MLSEVLQGFLLLEEEYQESIVFFKKMQDCIIYPLSILLSYEVVLKKPLSHTVTTLLLSLRTQSIRALQETVDFVTFPEEILNEKLHYLCSGVINHVDHAGSLSNIGKCFKF